MRKIGYAVLLGLATLLAGALLADLTHMTVTPMVFMIAGGVIFIFSGSWYLGSS